MPRWMEPLSRAPLVALVVLGLAAASIAAMPAGAQTAADKRAEAETVATELEQLRIEASQLDEIYAQRLLDLEQTQQSIIEAEARIEELSAEREARRAELEAFAVEAYIGGGSTEAVEVLESREPNEVGRRSMYLTVATGDRQDLLDSLAAAEHRLDRELQSLQESEAEAERLAEEARQAREGSLDAVAEQEALLARVEGELAELLAEEEARRAAEAQRRAEEQARQAAERASQAPPPAAPPPEEIEETNQEPPPAPETPVPAGATPGADTAVSLAWSLVGTPYVWGGSTPETGFDCSGFTSYVWGKAGYSLPHSAAAQAAMVTRLPLSELLPGDLVFYGWGFIHHVALYVGGGQIIHAPGAGRDVRVDSIYYWDQLHYAGRLP